MASQSWAIGVDLGGTKIEAALVGERGRIEQRLRQPTAADDGPHAVISQIADAVDELSDAAATAPDGLGVGVAGQIDGESGAVRFAPNLGWHDVDIKARLADALDLPVTITNDVRAATVGEWKFGAGQGFDDVVCVFVGTGVGSGVVSGGRVLTGASNIVGEVGHSVVDLDGPLCHCGNRGCLEATCAGWAIEREARRAVGANARLGARLLAMADGEPEAITARMVAQAARDGDKLATRLIDDASRALAAGMIGLVNAFNPARLILGGGIIDGIPDFLARVDEEVGQRALDAAVADLEVVGTGLGGDSGVVGAAALATASLTDSS